MIKIIFLDLGGVIILNRNRQIFQEWSEKLNLSIDELRNILRSFNNQRMEGKDLTFDNFIKNNGIATITTSQLKDFQKALWDSEYVNNELVKFIDANKTNYKFGVISNNFKEAEVVLLQKYQVPKFYQIFVSSSDIGVLKPDPKIYEYAIRQIDIRPEEGLFIDDSVENIEGAKSIGMKAIQFQNNEQLFQEIKKIIS